MGRWDAIRGVIKNTQEPMDFASEVSIALDLSLIFHLIIDGSDGHTKVIHINIISLLQ